MSDNNSHHRRLPVIADQWRPAYVVWELTLRCDHACHHCGSRAGVARANELTCDEALAQVDQLAALGCREVVLIGGEAYLHPGFLEVVRALVAAGIVASVTTGGRGVTAELARAMADAGVSTASVSIDGLQATHDRMRNARGSFAAATRALGHLAAAGIRTAANTNLNRLNSPDLELLYEQLCALGIGAWQIQLTAPLGRAADRTELILQPWELLDLVPRVAALKRRARADGITLMPGNNLGYFGPEEAELRSLRPGDGDHFAGCQAGRLILGIESDGAVKGCPSLQPSYIAGNLRDRPLAELWRDAPDLGFTRARTTDELWGQCADCEFAAICMGGCSFTAHALLGRRGNNPYCHYRARSLARRGLRERLVPVEAAAGLPFDCGRFELVLEDLDAPAAELPIAADDLVQITRRPTRARLEL